RCSFGCSFGQETGKERAPAGTGAFRFPSLRRPLRADVCANPKDVHVDNMTAVAPMHHGITVVIPVFNCAGYLSECIQSVCEQTLPAAEIIVIDDGSEDDTPKVTATWGSRVRYERVPHGGLPYARNHGLRFTETDFIAFVDSDDLWLPEKLE